ncbi:MAG: signal peptidase I [Planctomycetes bacterium]|nr:signal peptidase I [Planctomycetota bacterium]
MLVIIVVLGSFRSAVADWNDVPSGSMKPTILEGDRILVNKLAYGLRVPFSDWWIAQWEGPVPGDVVVCFSPDTRQRLVKRVIGVPGDRLELRDNRLFVNGQAVSYGPLDADTVNQIATDRQPRHRFASERLGGGQHPVMITPHKPARRSFTAVTVPPGCYFVMGDNRDNSRDSRFFGWIDRDAIVGRTTRIAFSVDPDRYYLPRWGRFLRSLP